VKRRVVVTGCGVISALGADSAAFASALAAGRSGIQPLKSESSDDARRNGALVGASVAPAWEEPAASSEPMATCSVWDPIRGHFPS
jgi:3-oxoacyl-(acyl-carrier-protein) synthase